MRRQLEWVAETFAGCGGPHYVIGRDAEAESLRANIGKLDLRPLLVKAYADIPVLLRSLGEWGSSSTTSESLVEPVPTESESLEEAKPVAASTSSPNPTVGRVLGGRYKLLERAGDGSFATVWRAHDLEGDREVAVKVLHSQWFDKPARVERFLRGARAMGRLEHPGVVEVLEPAALDGHHYFFVMPWRSGRDLRAAVKWGELGRDAALAAVADALDGLAHAHDCGLVHRDVKPANILLDAENRGSIADFDLVGGAESKQGTRTSAGMGTVTYAAPELFDDAANADERTDLYGAAMCVLFALTGEDPPWLMSLMKPGWLDSIECSVALREILRRALVTDKSARAGTCERLAMGVRAETQVAGEAMAGLFSDPNKEFVYRVLELYRLMTPPVSMNESPPVHPLMLFAGFGISEGVFRGLVVDAIEVKDHFQESKRDTYVSPRPMADVYRRMLAELDEDRAVNKSKSEGPYEMGNERRVRILDAGLQGLREETEERCVWLCDQSGGRVHGQGLVDRAHSAHEGARLIGHGKLRLFVENRLSRPVRNVIVVLKFPVSLMRDVAVGESGEAFFPVLQYAEIPSHYRDTEQSPFVMRGVRSGEVYEVKQKLSVMAPGEQEALVCVAVPFKGVGGKEVFSYGVEYIVKNEGETLDQGQFRFSAFISISGH